MSSLRRHVCLPVLLLGLAPAAAQNDSMIRSEKEGQAAPAPDATIAYGGDEKRSGELRVPKGKGKFPVVVLVHGGCWMNSMGGRQGAAAVAEALRGRGMAVWSITYRRIGDAGAGWPGTFQDVAAGTDYLKTLARRYPLDLGRVVFVGHSAGAHLASWAAARPKLPKPWTGTIKPAAVVLIDGPAGLTEFVGVDRQVCGQPVIVPLMGGTPAEKPAEYRLASASDHWPLGARQLFVLGSLGPLMQGNIAAARAGGDPVEVLAPPGADHFDIVTPSTPNGGAVIDFIATRALAAR